MEIEPSDCFTQYWMSFVHKRHSHIMYKAVLLKCNNTDDTDLFILYKNKFGYCWIGHRTCNKQKADGEHILVVCT